MWYLPPRTPHSALSLQLEQRPSRKATPMQAVQSNRPYSINNGREFDMRMLPCITLAAVTLVFAAGTHADAAAWCAYYDQSSGTNCGFYTIQQCQAAISGVGGYCAPNPEGPDHPATETRRKAR